MQINKNIVNTLFVPAMFYILLMVVHPVLADADSEKKTIGETAQIAVEQANLSYLARIDSGARVSSIHALELQVKNSSDEKKENIGKEVTFTTENEKHERTRVIATIVDVSKVRNAQGVEYRYVVDLKLKWQGVNKDAQVNLRDRSAMSYKLLIGRNWLSNDFVVDVDKSEGIIK